MATKDIQIIVKALDQATKPIKKMGAEMGDFVQRNQANFKKMAAVGTAAFAGIVGGAMKLTSDLGKQADRLLDLNAITGISTQALQEYSHVTRAAGVNSEALTNASAILTKRFNSLEEEGSRANETASKLGISLRDSAGEMRNMDDILMDSLKSLGQIANETERNAMANELFGRSYEDLIPIMALGGDEIERLRKEAGEMGLVMSDEALNAANDLRIAQENLNATFGAVKAQIASALIPVVLSLVERMQPVISSVSKWIGENQELVSIIAKVIAVVGGIMAALGTLGLVIMPVIAGFKTLAVVIGALTSPITLIVGAIALLAYAFYTDFGGIRTFVTEVFNNMIEKIKVFIGVVHSIINFVMPGLSAAFNVAMSFISDISEKTVSFVSGIFEGLRKTIEGVINFAKSAYDTASKIGSTIRDTASNIGGAVSGAVGNITGARAFGGPVQAGKPYLVGERGPEIFTPGSSGMVRTGGNGSATININMGGVTVQNEADEDRLIDKLKRTLEREARYYNLGIS